MTPSPVVDLPLWHQYTRLPDLPALTESRTAEVCVVGLGAAGLSAVLALRARGVDVVGVDAGRIGDGASGRNGGFALAGLAAFHHDAVRRLGAARARAWYELTLAELQHTAAQMPEVIASTGSVRIAMDAEEEADCAAQLGAMHDDGLPAAPYDGPLGTGLHFTNDASLSPAARCTQLAHAAVGEGAALHAHTPVQAIASGRVTTRSGVIRAATTIVCVDGSLEQVVPELAGRVRTARAQMLATAPTDEVRIGMPVYARWGWEYWQQLADGRVTLGGFRDVGGDEEWTARRGTTRRVQDALERFLRNHIGVRAPITHRWSGLIAYHDGDLPLVKEVRPGVIAVGAYKGHGNLLGPICARAAAARVTGASDPVNDLLEN